MSHYFPGIIYPLYPRILSSPGWYIQASGGCPTILPSCLDTESQEGTGEIYLWGFNTLEGLLSTRSAEQKWQEHASNILNTRLNWVDR